MKFEVRTEYLDPVELGTYEWVSVVLPDGRQVTVFSDKIYVATAEDVLARKDGLKIWEATGNPAGYGKISEPPVRSKTGRRTVQGL